MRDAERNFMTREELEAYLIHELEQEREDILKDQEILAVLNLIPEGIDLYQLYLDLLTEQIAGFYDSETEKLYVISDTERFGPGEEATFVHEYVHSLQQQHFDIHSLSQGVEQDSDASAALASLIEGDATVLEIQYSFRFFSRQERQELFQGSGDFSVFKEAPYAIQQLFLFPYVEGVTFVVALLGEGQTEAVNQAYRNPPVSMEQVLHPEKYFQGEVPTPVSLPDLVIALGTEWSQIDSDVLGEIFLRTYLETGTEDVIAATAAAGWDGDRFTLLKGPQDRRVFAVLLDWDSEHDAQEFVDVALMPLDGTSNQIYIGIQGEKTLLIIASTEPLIEAVRAQFAGF